jgi:hypothetical protein
LPITTILHEQAHQAKPTSDGWMRFWWEISLVFLVFLVFSDIDIEVGGQKVAPTLTLTVSANERAGVAAKAPPNFVNPGALKSSVC